MLEGATPYQRKERGMRDCEKKSSINPSRPELNDDEDWEKEAIIKTSYDPKKRASQMPVLMKLEGATPYQRKEFRAKEKLRHEVLEREASEDWEKEAIIKTSYD